MKINNLSFPYPVLGIGDDVEPRPGFSGTPEVSKTAKTYHFQIDLEMNNRDIADIVERGDAKYVCEVESPRTMFRKCYYSDNTSFTIEIAKSLLAERVTFQFSIVVIKPIKGYQNSTFHEDYRDYAFDLDPGDLLAFIGQFSYDVDIKYDKLRSVGSFMQITEDKFAEMPRYDFGGDKIDIKLPTPLYEQYKSSILGNRQFSHIIHSSIVFNALVFALLYYKAHKECLWARTLEYRIGAEEGLAEFKDVLETQDADDILKLAQVLLLNPYERLFDCISGLINQEED